MSECTTCSYYGKHLEGPSEAMPWPCIECPGGEKYVERGKRKHQVPLRIQLADAEHRLTELQEAVRWEREARSREVRVEMSNWLPGLYMRHGEEYTDAVQEELERIHECAVEAVDALVGGN